MFCSECEHYQETCTLEKIYASGYLKACPYLGMPEPIIPPSGGNLQVMTESIRKPGGLERVDIIPTLDAMDGRYYPLVFLCYGGKGTMTLGSQEKSLSAGAVYFGWSGALKIIQDRKIKELEDLIPLIKRRLRFDYSVVEYALLKQKTAPIQAERPKETAKKKGPGLLKPICEENMLKVREAPNDDKSLGDQMDLFAC